MLEKVAISAALPLEVDWPDIVYGFNHKAHKHQRTKCHALLSY